MNFPTKAKGQLTKAITTETSQSSQFSLTVDVNFPRNSIIITCITMVIVTTPKKR
jgi:hypothetical protein